MPDPTAKEIAAVAAHVRVWAVRLSLQHRMLAHFKTSNFRRRRTFEPSMWDHETLYRCERWQVRGAA